MNELPEAFLLSALREFDSTHPVSTLVFWHFFLATRKTPMCSWHSIGVTNTRDSRLSKIRIWFWLRVLEVLVCGQMVMFALGYTVKQCVVSQDSVTKQSDCFWLRHKKRERKELGPLYPFKNILPFSRKPPTRLGLLQFSTRFSKASRGTKALSYEPLGTF